MTIINLLQTSEANPKKRNKQILAYLSIPHGELRRKPL